MAVQLEAGAIAQPREVAETRNPFTTRNFRYWWFASVAAGIGVGIQTSVVPLFIRDRVALDNRAIAIGGELIAANLIGALLALVGGVAADRTERRRILVRTYLVTTLVASAYLLLSGLDVRAIWPVYPLAAVVGAAGAFTNPARQSMVSQMLTKAQLQNGIIYGNMAFMATLQFLGPMVGALCVGVFGLTTAFAVEVGMLGLGGFLFSRIATDRPVPTGKTVFGDLGDGLRYVMKSSSLTGLLLIGVIPGLFIMGPFAVTVVLMVEDIFKAGDAFVGLFWACFGGGILIGSIGMAQLRLKRRGLLAVGCIFTGGLAFLGYALSSEIWLAMPLLVVLGIVGPAIFINTVVALLQENTEPQMMGRVMSMYGLTFTASAPLGYAWAAVVADASGPRATLIAGALICTVIGGILTFVARPVTRLP